MEIIKQSEDQIEFVIARFPVHKQTQSFMAYNIYLLTQQQGIQKSVTLRLPCVREGCTTSCYFQAKSLNTNNRKDMCIVCGNSPFGKVYLDVGFKHFINKHQNYINLHTPLNVLINPHKNQFYFSPKLLKNSLESAVTKLIARELIKEMNFCQSPLIKQYYLDTYRINKQIKSIFEPPLVQKPYYVYNFCKFHPLIEQKSTQNQIVLFIKDMDRPIKVKLLTQEGKQICDNPTYLKYTKIVLLGSINTFIFCIPNKRTTEYFASNCNYHLQLQQRILVLIHQKSWRDELPRLNGSLIADQINNQVFAIGGYDDRKKDSLDYISCFLNCRWQIHKNKLNFLVQIQKNHHLFSNSNDKSNQTSSYFKLNSIISKFAVINSSFLISSNPSNKSNKKNSQKYIFLSLGGAIKDSIFFGTSKFVTKPPGIRNIIYDKNFELNPIIHHTFDSYFHFQKSNYIIMELPRHKSDIQKERINQFIIFGGSQGLQKQEDKQSKNNIALIFNLLKLDSPQVINMKFNFGQFLSDNIDQNATLLFDDLSKEYYVQSVAPFAKPIQLQTKLYAYCLIIQFNLISGCLNYRLGIFYYSNYQVQIMPQNFELKFKDGNS